MDNCDLEKLSCTGGKLDPPFKPDITSYKMTVESKVSKVTVDLLTSDCGASYKIVSGLFSYPVACMSIYKSAIMMHDNCSVFCMFIAVWGWL